MIYLSLSGSYPEPFYRPLIEFDCRHPMDHHDDAEFFATGWAERFAEGLDVGEADQVFVDASDDAFNDPALSGFEIAEEEASALAFDIDEFSYFHSAARVVSGGVFVKG